MALYDEAFSSDNNLARVLAHELAHQLYLSSNDDFKRRYRKATGWKLIIEGRAVFETRRKSGYVESDGADAVDEDFANNVEYFVFDRKRLKLVTESAEKWLDSELGDRLKLTTKEQMK